MIRNDVFVQRGIRAVKLWQLSVGAFLRINTVVILLGDVIRGNPWVVQAEMEGCKIWKKFMGAWGIKSSQFFHWTSLSMEGKYAVKLSITELFKISRTWRKHYNGRLWKMQMWSDSSNITPCHSYFNISLLVLTIAKAWCLHATALWRMTVSWHI